MTVNFGVLRSCPRVGVATAHDGYSTPTGAHQGALCAWGMSEHGDHASPDKLLLRLHS